LLLAAESFGKKKVRCTIRLAEEAPRDFFRKGPESDKLFALTYRKLDRIDLITLFVEYRNHA
jgi:hypothetical protein